MVVVVYINILYLVYFEVYSINTGQLHPLSALKLSNAAYAYQQEGQPACKKRAVIIPGVFVFKGSSKT